MKAKFRKFLGFLYWKVARANEPLYWCLLKWKESRKKNWKAGKYSYKDVKSYCEENNEKYITIEPEQRRKVFRAEYWQIENQKVEEFLSPEIYVAELHNVGVIGNSNWLFAGEYCLNDIVYHDVAKRYNYQNDCLKMECKDHLIMTYDVAEQKIGKAISMLGFASTNYYHLAIEIFSRLEYVDQFEEYRTLPILVDEDVLKIPNYHRLIFLMNTYRHQIIPIKKEMMYEVEHLIYPSYNTWLPLNLNDGVNLISSDFMVAKSALDNLRKKILKDVKPEVRRKIFISRSNTLSQRLKNEEAIKELFEAYGFEIVYPENMTIDQQARVFAEAEYIAGTSGAAMTNLVYASEGATFICLMPKEFEFHLYSTIAGLLGVNNVFMDAQLVERTKYLAMNSFVVDLGYCEDYLTTISEKKIAKLDKEISELSALERLELLEKKVDRIYEMFSKLVLEEHQ